MSINLPISIKDDKQKTIGILPNIQFDETILIRIVSIDNKVIDSGVSGSVLNVPVAYGFISVRYYSLNTNKLLKEISYDLSYLIGNNITLNTSIEDDSYQSILAAVKEKMDSPQLSEKEQEEHTEMILQATMDSNARNYVETKIYHIVSQRIKNYDMNAEKKSKEWASKIFSELYGMGIIQELDDDPEVGEIMVNGFLSPEFRCEIYYIKNQEKIKYEKTFQTFQDMYNIFKRSISFSQKELNQVENARVEATRSNGDRVNIIIPQAASSYVMNIRKFGNFTPNSETMKKSGTINDELNELFEILVLGKANIGIGGGMGTGKTTVINYCLTHTDKEERKVVIASVAETDVERTLKGHDIIILNVDDSKNFTFDSQIRASLRTTASRVIVPESRGSEFKQVHEANLKTKGNMFTAHALDAESFLDMCVDMYLGDNTGDVQHIRNKIAKGLNIIVIMQKVGNTIRIKSLSEVLIENGEYIGMSTLYYWKRDPENPTIGKYQRGNKMSKSLIDSLNEYGVPLSTIMNMKIHKE